MDFRCQTTTGGCWTTYVKLQMSDYNWQTTGVGLQLVDSLCRTTDTRPLLMDIKDLIVDYELNTDVGLLLLDCMNTGLQATNYG